MPTSNAGRWVTCWMVGVTLWYSASVMAQMPLVPIPNAVGLADQRLNLLPADGYQLIEQANQAFQADQILRAGDRLNQLLYQFGDHLVPLPDHTEGEFKSFVSVIDFVNAWVAHSQRPDVFTPVSKARQFASLKQGIEPALHLSRQFPGVWSDPNWNLALSDHLLESNDVIGARWLLERYQTEPVVGVGNTFTGRWQLSAERSVLDSHKRLARQALLEILEQRQPQALRKLKEIEASAGQNSFSLGGVDGDLHELLLGFYQQHLGGKEPAIAFTPPAIQELSQHRVVSESVRWTLSLEDLLHGRGVDQRLELHPVVDEGRLFINTLNGVLAVQVDTGAPLFGDGDEAFWLFQSGGDQVADWYDSEIPYWGVAKPDLDVEGDLLAVRQGDPALTHHLSVEAGQIEGNSIAVLDLSEQGRILDGFPLVLPPAEEDSYQVFATAPRIVGENLLVGIRENQAFQCRHYLACYDLAGGVQKWRCYLGSARPIANRTITDLMSAELTILGTQAIVSTNTGLLASVDFSGHLDWVCSYPRSYHQIESASLEEKTVRSSQVQFNRDNMTLVVTPADSKFVFSVDIRSGLLNSSIERPLHANTASAQLPDGTLLLLGHELLQCQQGEFQENELAGWTPLAAFSICGDRLFFLDANNGLIEAGLDVTQQLKSLKRSDLPVAAGYQLQVLDQTIILFDGKMVRAVDARPMSSTSEQ